MGRPAPQGGRLGRELDSFRGQGPVMEAECRMNISGVES